MEGPIKSLLTVCWSVHPSVQHFYQDGLLVFLIFGAMVDNWYN